MPPHNGHLYLFDQALEQVDELTVMLFWHDGQPISGPQRLAWLRQLRPNIRFVECTDRHPVDYNNPAIWDLWMASIRKTYQDNPNVVFASEDYGRELAERLGADFVCLDKERAAVPVSATLIREAPWRVWEHIPAPVRPSCVQRICIVGGESTGKSTLAKELAHHFQTNYVAEYAREFLAEHGNVCTEADMPIIAAEQVRREDLAQQTSNRFLFCDTNALITKLWSQHYFGKCSGEVEELVTSRPYSFYLLMQPDIPWVADGMRDTPHGREWFYKSSRQELERLGAAYREVKGANEQRLISAKNHIYQYFGFASHQ